jgi:hypothetical protein
MGQSSEYSQHHGEYHVTKRQPKDSIEDDDEKEVGIDAISATFWKIGNCGHLTQVLREMEREKQKDDADWLRSQPHGQYIQNVPRLCCLLAMISSGWSGRLQTPTKKLGIKADIHLSAVDN